MHGPYNIKFANLYVGDKKTNCEIVVISRSMSRFSLCWDIERLKLAVGYRRFGENFRSYLQRCSNASTAWHRHVGPMFCPETTLYFCVTSQKSKGLQKTKDSDLIGGEYSMNGILLYLLYEPIFRSADTLKYFNSDFLVIFVFWICPASGEDSCTCYYILYVHILFTFRPISYLNSKRACALITKLTLLLNLPWSAWTRCWCAPFK
jgi:hypothetical protein